MNVQDALPGMGRIDGYHDFREKLEYANVATNVMRLETFYRSCFPATLAVFKVTDIGLQRQGIDTIVRLENKAIYFDEKVRAKNYGDILLEEYSVWKHYPLLRGTEIDRKQPIPPALEAMAIRYRQLKPGWITGGKRTDYITYVVKPTKQVYFLPFLLLQRAWQKYHDEWLAASGRKIAKNKTYVTTNIAVPVDVLYRALYEAVSWR